MELAIPIALIAAAFVLLAWLRRDIVRMGGFRAPDTMEFDAVAPKRAPGAPLPPWPEWPVVREHGDRQPQARSYKANR